MSFSHQMKECIRENINTRDKRRSCLYGMLLYNKTVTREEICLKSGSEVFRAMFPALLKTVCGASVMLRTETRPRKDGGSLYIYRISGEKHVTSVRRMFHIHEDRHIDRRSTPDLGAFLGGVFLTCGSITNPEKEYHLEFSVPTEPLCKELCSLLEKSGIHANVTKGRYIWKVWLTDSEDIEDLLTLMGAQKCTLELMEIKIQKDVKNQVIRRNNCDMANIDKTISASERQCRDIQVILKHDGFRKLSPELKNLAEIRLENPHLSLSELSELLEKPVSRAGVNHRFRKLAAIAEGYRKEGDSYGKHSGG